jgi:predicted MFS family arabinose efflux permease
MTNRCRVPPETSILNYTQRWHLIDSIGFFKCCRYLQHDWLMNRGMNVPIDNRNQLAKAAGIRRGRVTWYSYLALGFFTYLQNIQGNILPFLKTELDLSYRVVSLHASAYAAGLMVVGLLGDWIIRRSGRHRALLVGVLGMSAAAVLLCLAPTAWASIGCCALMGIMGGLIAAVVPAVLAEVHGEGGRDVSFAEATAVTYAFAVLGPLVMGLSVAMLLDWRGVVLLGAVFGMLVLVAFRRTTLPEPTEGSGSTRARLPAAYWAYWALLAIAVAIEFCVLIWAPEFLERVAGLSRGTAAASAAAFSLAMLIGRIGTGGLVRWVAAPHIFVIALAVTLLGFLVYWATGHPLAVVAGLFILGLGVAPLYPLSLGFALGAAGAQSDAASARVLLAEGLAILLIPAVLGGLADEVGLRLAHLMLPGLAVMALLCLALARALQRRAFAYAR